MKSIILKITKLQARKASLSKTFNKNEINAITRRVGRLRAALDHLEKDGYMADQGILAKALDKKAAIEYVKGLQSETIK